MAGATSLIGLIWSYCVHSLIACWYTQRNAHLLYLARFRGFLTSGSTFICHRVVASCVLRYAPSHCSEIPPRRHGHPQKLVGGELQQLLLLRKRGGFSFSFGLESHETVHDRTVWEGGKGLLYSSSMGLGFQKPVSGLALSIFHYVCGTA
eukprot:5359271-Amphidinium_carterae.2